MTRLIDADALDMYESLKSYYGDAWRDAQKEIDNAPTVDAVPVIRCKDCKYYSCGTVEGKHLCMSVKYRFTPTAEDEWCSRAERKEE